jgi:hypothetical protein
VTSPEDPDFQAQKQNQQNLLPIQDHADFIGPSVYLRESTLDAHLGMIEATAGLAAPYRDILTLPFVHRTAQGGPHNGGDMPRYWCERAMQWLMRAHAIDGACLWASSSNNKGTDPWASPAARAFDRGLAA